MSVTGEGTYEEVPPGAGSGGGGGASIHFGTSPPSGSETLWWNTDDGNLYVKYNDGSSTQWVTASRGMAGSGGSVGGAAAAMSVVHETVFAGMTPQSFTSGVNVTLSDGVVYAPSIPGGGSLSITANGLRVQQGSSAENFMWISPANQSSGRSILHDKIGSAALRTRRWGVWTRLHSYTLAASAHWFYITILGNSYPKNFFGVRRGRNVASAPNTATGGLLRWIARGVDHVSSLSANADTDSATDVWHDTGELVTLMLFKDPWTIDYYYGDWSSGWPDIADMKFGGGVDTRDNYNSNSHISMRDPRMWHLGFGGGQGYSTSTEFTVDRFRLTIH